MKVVFLKRFSKDLNKIKRSNDLNSILEVIELVKNANQISDVSGVKKLVGFDDAYRLRTGDYRIGVFVTEDQVEFARVAHRKDIYKIFP